MAEAPASAVVASMEEAASVEVASTEEAVVEVSMVVVEAATAVAVTAKFSQKGPLNQRAFCFSDLLASDFSCQAPRRPSNTPNPNYINRIDKISTLHGIMAKIAIMDIETQNRS
jgi:hypothetical protein